MTCCTEAEPKAREPTLIFYLGTDRIHWLGTLDVPLFVSRRWLAPRRTLPRARAGWALDSGAFTELKEYGRWTITPREYAGQVKRFAEEIGNMAFAASMDWMCEPAVIHGGTFGREKFVGTKLSVREHQRLTVQHYLELKTLAPELPWVPVLQGWRPHEYLDCLDDYRRAGVNLAAEPLVGLGSVCRRQGTSVAEGLVRELHGMGLKLHLFGFKVAGLKRCAQYAASSDSMAWSYAARMGQPLPGCTHPKCNHCPRYAMRWREKVLRSVERGQTRPVQGLLF